MRALLERITAGETLVADGAMGTLLFQKGLPPGHCPEAWNLSHPADIEDIARQYLAAGADIIQTNTFGGSPAKLAEYGFEDQTETINRTAVELVRKAVAGQALISGSMGPSGRLLIPYGDFSPAELQEGFQRQAEALIGAGVDVICVETMTDLQEAGLAIRAVKTVAGHIPVMASLTFDATPRGFFTVMGVSIPEAVQGLLEAGAEVVGSNCGNGIENMLRIARGLRAQTGAPLLIQSNAGVPETVAGKLVYRESPELFAEKTRELMELRVAVIGGCCGTGPGHIRAIRDSVTAAQAGRPPANNRQPHPEP